MASGILINLGPAYGLLLGGIAWTNVGFIDLELQGEIELEIPCSIYPIFCCPGNKSPLIEARTTKLEQKMQNPLVKIPIILEVDWSWPSRSNLTFNSNFIGPMFWHQIMASIT